jgi:hypothetical protein
VDIKRDRKNFTGSFYTVVSSCCEPVNGTVAVGGEISDWIDLSDYSFSLCDSRIPIFAEVNPPWGTKPGTYYGTVTATIRQGNIVVGIEQVVVVNVLHPRGFRPKRFR